MMNPMYPATYNPYLAQMQTQMQTQTKVIEVVPIDTIEEGAKIQVQMGGTVLGFARDDSFVTLKAVGLNGQDQFIVYDRRPPAPPAPVFDPSVYVTREEMESRLAALSGPTRAKKEAAE